MDPEKLTRRTFLGRLGGLAVGLTLAPLAGCENNAFAPVTEGTAIPFLTPNDDFYVQFGANGAVAGWEGARQIAREDWSLTIDGLVAETLALEAADLEAEEAVTVLATLRCIADNNVAPGLVSTAAWTGVPLRRLLDRAGVDRQRVRRLRVYGADGFTDNLPLDKLYDGWPADLAEPMLVYQMNGQALTPAHGAPVRLLVPGHYGYKSVKWIERIEATDRDEVFGTYQNVLGYFDDGTIRVASKITQPLRGTRITAGPARLFGYALSGFSGIEKVEVAIDGDTFAEARILPLKEIKEAAPDALGTLQLQESDRYDYPFRGVWVLWEYFWEARAGNHTIRVRAVDAAGNTQPPIDSDPTDGDNPVFEINVVVD